MMGMALVFVLKVCVTSGGHRETVCAWGHRELIDNKRKKGMWVLKKKVLIVRPPGSKRPAEATVLNLVGDHDIFLCVLSRAEVTKPHLSTVPAELGRSVRGTSKVGRRRVADDAAVPRSALTRRAHVPDADRDVVPLNAPSSKPAVVVNDL